MKLKLLTALLAMMVIGSVQANNKVIYGEDDRLDLHEVTNSLHHELALSTAALMDADDMKCKAGNCEITGTKMVDRGFCEENRSGCNRSRSL